MRFSISASISTSWRRRSSCSRSSGVPWSRSGSVGGSSASSRRTCVSSCCCVCCSCSICLRVSSLASPISVSAEGGSGDVARPARRLAAAGQARLRDRLRLLGRLARARVDEDHLERRILEHAVEALRVDEAHAEQRAVDGDRDAERDLQRREAGSAARASRGRGGERIGLAGRPRWRRDVDGDRERAGGVVVVVVVGASAAASRLPASRRGARCTVAATSSVSRSIAPTRTRTALPRGERLGADGAKDERQRVGAHQAVLHHRRVELVDAVAAAGSCSDQ